jgi:hypothetical protein
MNRLKSQLHYLHVLKHAKKLARRALLTPASHELIKVIVECAINTVNRNHKSSNEKKNKLSKYKSRSRALVDSKISFKSKRELLFQRSGFIIPLLTSMLSGVIEVLMNNN